MLIMSAKKVTTSLNVEDDRPHLNGEEEDGRPAGTRASSVQRRFGIAESPDTECGAHRQLFENVWFVFDQTHIPDYQMQYS